MVKRNSDGRLLRSLIEADRKTALNCGATPAELREFERMKNLLERKQGTRIEGGLEVFLEVRREFEKSRFKAIAGRLMLLDDFHLYLRAILDGRQQISGSSKGDLRLKGDVMIARMWDAGGSEFLKSLSAACMMILTQLTGAEEVISIRANNGTHTYRREELGKIREIVERAECLLAK